MKKLFLLLSLLTVISSAFSQDFFRGGLNKEKDYIILTNPTIENIETIRFLLSKGIFKADTGRINFVGIYHPDQKYDFSQTAEYIAGNHLSGFHLHEVKGELTEANLYRENPCSEEIRFIFRSSIAMFFFGGPDIPPSVYGEDNHHSVVTDSQRHYFELSCMFHLIGGSQNPEYRALLEENPDYLVTGFCLGLQTMNVASGGSLFQDIPAQLYDSFNPDNTLKLHKSKQHSNYWHVKDPKLTSFTLHKIRFSKNDFFGQTIKLNKNLKPLVYSSHHQAIKNIGEGLEVTAFSVDGKVIEGVAHSNYPNVFSVQFHPEKTSIYENHEMIVLTPKDKPLPLHERISKKSLYFHQLYWAHISDILKNSPRK